MILPGIERIYSFLVAKNPACGPPNPKGVPNLCDVPQAISNPYSPGLFYLILENKSTPTATF